MPEGLPAGLFRPNSDGAFARLSAAESGGSGFARHSNAASALQAQQSAAEAAIYARRSATESATYARQSPAESATYTRQSGLTDSGGYARQSGLTDSGGYMRRSGTESSGVFARPSGESGYAQLSGDGTARRGSAERFLDRHRRAASGDAAANAEAAARLNGASPRASPRVSRLRGPSTEPSPRAQLSSGRGSGDFVSQPPGSGRQRSSGEDLPRRSGDSGALPLAEPQLAPRATPAAAAAPADTAPLLSGGGGAAEAAEDELGPAVRVLLPGKQSLTRGELAAVTNGLRRVRTFASLSLVFSAFTFLSQVPLSLFGP